MHLITYDDTGELHFTTHLPTANLPPYAILSHTWGPSEEEVTFHELQLESSKTKAGYRKIQLCADQARRDGLHYFWIDSCCIDQSNSAEVVEATKFMSRWLQDAQACYVYLSDVSRNIRDDEDLGDSCWNDKTFLSSITKSAWFTRKRSNQERAVPMHAVFFCNEGFRLGTECELLRRLADGILTIRSPHPYGGQCAVSDRTHQIRHDLRNHLVSHRPYKQHLVAEYEACGHAMYEQFGPFSYEDVVQNAWCVPTWNGRLPKPQTRFSSEIIFEPSGEHERRHKNHSLSTDPFTAKPNVLETTKAISVPTWLPRCPVCRGYCVPHRCRFASRTSTDSTSSADSGYLSNGSREDMVKCANRLIVAFETEEQDLSALSCTISCVLNSARRLNKSELEAAVMLHELKTSSFNALDEDFDVKMTRILTSAGSIFVENAGGYIYFKDKTMPTFLRNFRVDGIDASHKTMANICFAILHDELRSDVKDYINTAEKPFLRSYAREFWRYHCDAAASSSLASNSGCMWSNQNPNPGDCVVDEDFDLLPHRMQELNVWEEESDSWLLPHKELPKPLYAKHLNSMCQV